MTPTERRALTVLLLWLLASLGFDWLGRRQPERVTAWLGPEYARELGVVGGASPAAEGGAAGAAPAPDAVASGRPRGAADPPVRLPYDGSGRLLVNAADSAALLSLRGVGPVTAGRMLAWRRQHGRFRVPEDLLSVRGIGPATLDRLLPQISFAGLDSSATETPAGTPGDSR